MALTKSAPALNGVDTSRGWFPLVREPFAGAWQRNLEVRVETALANPVLFRCISLIAGDIAKMCVRLVRLTGDGIWEEAESAAFSPVLRKPNRYQNRIQFFSSWMQSKLTFGNTYVLKARDNRGLVTALYVLDPTRVRPMVSPDGSVFYQISGDNLSGVADGIDPVPASEIIHDRWNTFYHPLCGLSPIYACGLAALQGREIQKTSTLFFKNGSTPGGILTHPEAIDDETAKLYRDRWQEKFGGDNQGSIAVLGNGLTYQSIAMNSVDAQLIEQLKWTGETICGCLGVPAYMAGVGSAPLNNNVQSLAELYYAQCVQIHIESVELCLDEGLGIGAGTKKDSVTYGVEFDLDDLLRMDTASQVKTLGEGVRGGVFMPDEARRKLNLRPVEGGDQVYLQQQNYSLKALAKRDAKEDPFATAKPNSPPPAANEDAPTDAEALKALLTIHKGFAHVRR